MREFRLGTGGVCLGCGGGEWVEGLEQGLEEWGGVMSVRSCESGWILCVDGRSRYLYIV